MKIIMLTIFLIIVFSFVALLAGEDDSLIITTEMVANAEKVIGLEFTDTERDSLLDDAHDNLASYLQIRETTLDNSVFPALLFNPLPYGFTFDKEEKPIKLSTIGDVKLPGNLEELCYYSVRQLSELIRTGKVTSVQLTRLALKRLKKYDTLLHCVISLTEERAISQAEEMDAEIAQGIYRGPLHGIPYGAKDLLSVKGYETTWGAEPYKDQVIDSDATVIQKLDSAGAVLVAKLTLGALAWGDVWFGDTTRNPWNLEQGSSGSSAGSASAVSAGLVPFAIGTETWGSIVSPSTRCGTTGLRPTYGRVSRSGAMALSWSMDKIGAIAREVEDCAIVFDAIRGVDKSDPTLYDAAFNYNPNIDITKLKVGYLKTDFDNDTTFKKHNDKTLEKIRKMGIELIEIELPDIPIYPMSIILSAEAAAAFDELTRSDWDDLMVRQIKSSWPNVFRSSRLIPAVEYINANRLRTLIIEKMDQLMEKVDLYISPTFEGDNLLLTNLSGHPCVVLPNGFNEEGSPVSITFIGKLFDEATLLAFVRVYQKATEFHKLHPAQFTP